MTRHNPRHARTEPFKHRVCAYAIAGATLGVLIGLGGTIIAGTWVLFGGNQ